MAIYADLVRSRELFRNLFHRDFQAKYRGSILGVLWSLVTPIVLMVVYLIVFGVIDGTSAVPHYPVYLLSGIACWTFFNISLQVAARSILDSATLVRKVRFPRQLVTFSAVATQSVTFVAMLVILISVSLVFVPQARGTVWLVIPIAVLFLAVVLGCSLTVACLNVLLRDYEYFQTAALLPWFFLSPILWGYASILPAAAVQTGATGGPIGIHGPIGVIAATGPSELHRLVVDTLLWGNFVAPPIQAVHYVVWLGALPPVSDVLYLIGAAVVSLALGAFVFNRVDNRIAIEL